MTIRTKSIAINRNSTKVKEYESALGRSLSKLSKTQREKALQPTIKNPELLKAIKSSQSPLYKLTQFFGRFLTH